MKKFLLVLCAFLMCLSLVACGKKEEEGSGEAATEGDPIVFGLTTPVTGDTAAGGQQAEYGTRLALEEINAAGGILLSDGLYHKVELAVEDDQGDKVLCDTTVRRLVESKGAVVILGPYFSGQTIALDATMKELKVALINSATNVGIDDLQNKYLWHNRCDDGLNGVILGKAVVDAYAEKNGSTDDIKVGIICGNDDTGIGAATVYENYFKEHGIDYYRDEHDTTVDDLTAYIQKAIAAGCNCWVSSCHDKGAVAIAKAMYEQGLRDQIVFTNPILAQTNVLEMMEPEWVEGWGCVADYSASDTSNPLAAEFTKKWEAAYDVTPDVQGALYYCHTMLAAKAVADAGVADGEAIADAIGKISGFESIIGTVYADTYSNLIYSIGITKIRNLVPTMESSVSMVSSQEEVASVAQYH